MQDRLSLSIIREYCASVHYSRCSFSSDSCISISTPPSLIRFTKGRTSGAATMARRVAMRNHRPIEHHRARPSHVRHDDPMNQQTDEKASCFRAFLAIRRHPRRSAGTREGAWRRILARAAAPLPSYLWPVVSSLSPPEWPNSAPCEIVPVFYHRGIV